MEETTKVTKTLGSAIDDVIASLEPLDESSRRIAVRAACERLGIVLLEATPQAAAAGPPHTTPHVPAITGTARPEATDIRSFAQQKRPSTAVERAVLVAFYLAERAPEAERKDTIDKQDLKKYFKQAGFPLPKRPEATLVHAKDAGYLDAVGEGKYRLNPVGYNLIAHNLPRGHAQPQRKPQRVRSRRRRVREKMVRK